jgi:hypothetical protein
MDCRIVIKERQTDGTIVFRDLTKEVAEGLVANAGVITKRDILLYDLGNATGLEKQQMVIELIENEKLSESYADDENETEVIEKELES